MDASEFRQGGHDLCVCGKWRLPMRLQLRGASIHDHTIDVDATQINVVRKCLELLEMKLLMRFQCPACGKFFESVNDADAAAAYEAAPPKSKA